MDTIIIINIIIVAVLFSVWDLKYKELPPYIYLAYIIFAFVGFMYNTWQAVVMLSLAFGFGWLMYYIKAWEGGDSKVLMMYSMLFPISLAWLFVQNIAFYGLIYWLVFGKGRKIAFIPALSIAMISTLFGIYPIELIISWLLS